MQEQGNGNDAVKILGMGGVAISGKWCPKWRIEKYHGDPATEAPFEVDEFLGNCLLTEGIVEMWTLITGGGGVPFNSGNSRLGVGDSAALANSGQVGLQAVTDKLYKTMDAGYPQIVGAVLLFRATFTGTEAVWAWNEFSVMNGATEATAKNLSRKAEPHGAKGNGDTWILQLSVTLT
jgi:hypothetical protein